MKNCRGHWFQATNDSMLTAAFGLMAWLEGFSGKKQLAAISSPNPVGGFFWNLPMTRFHSPWGG